MTAPHRIGFSHGASRLALIVLLAQTPAPGAAEDAPWRLRDAAKAPSWLELGGTWRVRYEALSSSLRPGVEGSDQVLAERLLLRVRIGDEKRFGDARGAPRLTLQYDYASGDGDPNDDRNGRFDTLYGARRFEFGPTGIFGVLARSNISSPGGGIELSPRPGWSLMAAYRAAWLASRRDALTTNGVRDPEGESGSFIGHLLETSLRVSLLPGNLGLELGGAHLFAGELLTSQTPAVDDTTYGYVQTTLTF